MFRRRFWRPRLFRGPRLFGFGCGIIGLILMMCIFATFLLNVFARRIF